MGQCLDSCFAVTSILTEEEKEVCEQVLDHGKVSSVVQEGDATLLGHNKHAILTSCKRDALNELNCDNVECNDKLIIK